ncbi:translocon-associated protein subunit beta-like protein [Perkinsela sp. CCAP 1560/4]|nr:translocon-associated protein subunit beta-like protein [Perkinsela sp. CCAP 1560/4]|eukprot:KNH09278.1 translocon-associated protein subunit beta-like protein [Perkinsela sp. CCAP 1560/4]
MLFALCCVNVCTFLACSEDNASAERPLLVMKKHISSTDLIEKGTASVQIIVTNTGAASAYQVQVVDEFQGDKYGKSIEKIDAGETVLVGYSKRVDSLGEFYIEPARAVYRLDLEEDSQKYSSYSTQTNEELPGDLEEKQPIVNVMTSRQYSRKHRYYAKEVATAAFFSLLTTCLPFAIYKRNVSQLSSK